MREPDNSSDWHVDFASCFLGKISEILPCIQNGICMAPYGAIRRCQIEKKVVIVDLDPQSNLTAAFLDEDQIEALWDNKIKGSTIFQCIRPSSTCSLGEIALSGTEDAFAGKWSNSQKDSNLYRPMRILGSFWQVMQLAAAKVQADIILVDIAPNLGAINRSVLIATDYVAIPLGADLFSLQGLRDLGLALGSWRISWKKRLDRWTADSERSSRPDQGYGKSRRTNPAPFSPNGKIDRREGQGRARIRERQTEDP
ncbi:MAG: ParA family protein [Leptospirillia bacterium]